MDQIFTDESQLIAGHWYALGLANFEGVIEWGGARLARYDGDGCWSDDDGEIEGIWDPIIQQFVEPGAADQFSPQ